MTGGEPPEGHEQQDERASKIAERIRRALARAKVAIQRIAPLHAAEDGEGYGDGGHTEALARGRTERTVAIATLVMALASLGSCAVSTFHWGVMSSQLDRMEEANKTAHESVEAARIQADAAKIQAQAARDGVAEMKAAREDSERREATESARADAALEEARIARIQQREAAAATQDASQRIARATEGQVDATKRTLEMTQAPRLAIKQIRAERWESGVPSRVTLYIQNVGVADADAVHLWTGSVIRDAEPGPNQYPRDEMSSWTVDFARDGVNRKVLNRKPPSEWTDEARRDVEDVKSGAKKVYVGLLATYCDGFDLSHELGFCGEWIPGTPDFKLCVGGNYERKTGQCQAGPSPN